MKIHNVFIEALGKEIQYYTALSRSLDSSLGNMLENMALEIAKLSYQVERGVDGIITQKQTDFIARLLEAYKRKTQIPSCRDYQSLPKLGNGKKFQKRHESDYYLFDANTKRHYLVELKIGGDLDNKKARSEKEALLEQYAILASTLDSKAKITCHFATAYNRFGEGRP